ncbi:MAG: dihydroneopterin aldolase, partial [Rhizobiaceae bacterium]
CSFYAYHGVLKEEEELGQRFYVDATLEVDSTGALEEDSIEGTVHYGEVFAVIERLVTTQRRALIETLALDIAKQLCKDFKLIRQARITVRKPNAPIAGILDYVEVTVCHPNQ